MRWNTVYSLATLITVVCFFGSMPIKLTAQVQIKQVQTFQIGHILGQIYEVRLNQSTRGEGIRVLHSAGDGTYYFVTPSGFYHWTHDSVYEVEGLSNLGGHDLNTSAEDREGRIWFYLDPFGKNVQIANLWAYKPGKSAENVSHNPLVNILSQGEKIHKIHQLANRTLVFQTNAHRLILFRKSDDFEFIDLPPKGTLIGGGEKSIVIGSNSDQGYRISIYYPHSDSWEKLPRQDETSSVDHCIEYNGHLSCISGTAFLISHLSAGADQWTWLPTPGDLFHFQKSSNTGVFQDISGGNIHTLSKGNFAFSHLLNEINDAIPVEGAKKYLFSDDKKWILSNDGLFFVTLRTKNNFHTALNDLPDRQISTRGLIELGDETLLAGTYSGFFEINTSAIESGKIEAKKLENKLNCSLRYVQGFHLSEFRDSGLYVYFDDIHLHQLGTGTCTPFNLRTQQISEIWGMEEIDSSLILVGSTTGLFLLDMEKEAVSSFEVWDSQSQIDFRGVSINRITAGTSTNTYWLSTNKGLFLIINDLTDGHPKGVVLEAPLTGIPVHKIAKPAENELLVTTMNQGLLHLSNTDDGWRVIQEFNTSNFLSTNRTHSIEMDEYGGAWLGTDDGLYHICLDLGIARRFDTQDGVSHKEFNRLASLYLQNGWMVFGGIDGYNFFKPMEFSKPGDSHSIGINALKVNYENPDLLDNKVHSSQENGMFEIPAKATSITPLPDLPFSDLVESIFYRKANNQSNWVKASDRRIPSQDLKAGAENQLEVLITLPCGKLLLSKKPIVLHQPDGSVVSGTRILMGAAIVIIILSGIWLFFISRRFRDKEQVTQLPSEEEEMAVQDEKPETLSSDNAEIKTTVKEKRAPNEKISEESESPFLIADSEEPKPEMNLPYCGF